MTDPIRPELISMPEDVMRIIMGECDFISIQRLRKTCHDLRNFINLTKPKYHFKTIEIAGDLQGMLLHFSEEDSFDLRYPNGQKISISYEKIDKESTKIQWYREDKICTKIIENSNFIDFVCRDFESIVNRNSTIFETLSINLEQMGHVNIQKVLESCGKTPIKVHALSIQHGTCQEDVVEILRCICPDTIERLEINFFESLWDISKILESDHWKKAKELRMDTIPVRVGIQNFEHFDYAKFCMEECTVDDVIRVKENFLNSPSTTKIISISFNRFNDEDRLIEYLGQPYQRYQRYQPLFEWFFRRPDNNVLFIEYSGSYFDCIIQPLEYVPENADVIG